VISVGAAAAYEPVLEELIDLERPEERPGPASCIIDPRGHILAEVPTAGEEAIITAEGSLEAVMDTKRWCDIAGHYSRPDVLQLTINRRPLVRLVESGFPDQSVATTDIYPSRRDSAEDDRQEAENTG
jgi:hypothetical protein